jgi:hypothetical protein
MNMTTSECLQNIYNAARMAGLTAQQHELIKQCAEELAKALAEALKPKEEPKVD